MRSLIVIPAFNEESTVGDVVEMCSQYGDVLVINDGSTDSTLMAARRASALVVTNACNKGYEYSLNVGYLAALELHYDLMITIDADGQLPTECIPKFMNSIEQGACIVIGHRKDIPRVCERFLSYLSSRLSPIIDPYCGMKAYNLSVVKFKKFSNYNSIGTSLALKYIERNLRCQNIEIEVRRREGQSKFGGRLSSEMKLFVSMLFGTYRLIINWIKKNAN